MAAALLIADALTVVQQFINGPQWGVWKDGMQVIGQDVTSFSGFIESSIGGALGLGMTTQADFEFEARWAITNAPQEGGAFQSYNIVQTPYRVAITFAAGGTAANRTLLKSQIQNIVGTPNLYTALTPEGPITSLAAVGMAYRRHPEDVGLLAISVMFAQVRPAGDPQFSTSQTPTTAAGATAPVAGGGTEAITSPTPDFASATSVQSFGTQAAVIATGAVMALVHIPKR